MKKKTIMAARVLFVIYLITVAYLCFWHFTNVSTFQKYFLIFPADKVVHFLMFLPFPILAYAAFGRKFEGPWQAIGFVLLLFLIGCSVAAVTELVQSRIPYRSADPADFRADAIALCISSLSIFIWDLKRVK